MIRARPAAAWRMLVVLLANLAPVIGILFFDWDGFAVVFLYWLETVVIGFFTLLKMLVHGWFREVPRERGRLWRLLQFLGFALKTTATVVALLGLFLGLCGVYFFGFYQRIPRELLDQRASDGVLLYETVKAELSGGMLLAAAALFLEHAVFFVHYLAGRGYSKGELADLGTEPGLRVAIMWVTLFAAGFLHQHYGLPNALLIVLVLLKTAAELVEARKL